MISTKEYLVCNDVPDEVAGIRHDGPGSTLQLTDSQAAHALRIGHIRKPVRTTKQRKTRPNGRNKR